ncbi:HAD family hydrolase [Alteribacillus bidgolensis]|uniref:Haloacid dehalogenase superfamily, subfamily IA, variant 3 with third motif having DD or ED n=1 Tax=Alteribacillus bidgolensis TaxID=930129 RepID=A0A1G8KZ32_9BACI|nr:HAD family hydrolase [Alteribacillus bidgolensis]SDI48641.1 haloacid dehalogenase superfamily, subfamily IA, variant 3 with third motif having DD or ED [Alteribacillus bidgolensis]
MKAVIFDFDGLIMDTETPQYEVLQEIFYEYNSNLPLSVWQKEIGTSTDFCPFRYLESKTKKKFDKENLQKALDRRFQQRLAKEAARPGVKNYLNEAKRLGLHIGLASSSNYQWVSTHLKNLGLFPFFKCIKTSDDVENVKPDPSLYLEAAKCLQVDPKECIVFEDSANGALAAKKAGMSCVIIPNKVTNELEFCNVERRLLTMEECTLNQIIDEIETKK